MAVQDAVMQPKLIRKGRAGGSIHKGNERLGPGIVVGEISPPGTHIREWAIPAGNME